MSWKDEFRLKIEASMVVTPACIEIPRFSDSEIGIDLARAHEDYVDAVAMAFQVRCTIDEWVTASDNERRMYETEIIPPPPNYFQDEIDHILGMLKDMQPLFDKHFQERYILPQWAMPVILLVVFVILTMIIGA